MWIHITNIQQRDKKPHWIAVERGWRTVLNCWNKNTSVDADGSHLWESKSLLSEYLVVTSWGLHPISKDRAICLKCLTFFLRVASVMTHGGDCSELNHYSNYLLCEEFSCRKKVSEKPLRSKVITDQTAVILLTCQMLHLAQPHCRWHFPLPDCSTFLWFMLVLPNVRI